MKRAKPLFLFWLLAIGVIVYMTLTYESESADLYGIAETKEIVVNWEHAVDIKKIHVVEGQEIKSGDRLVELDSPDLSLKISQITHRHNELKVQRGMNAAEIRAKLRQLQAEKSVKLVDLSYRVQNLSRQLKFNKEMAAGLKSLEKSWGKSKNEKSKSSIQMKIDSLEEEKKLYLKQVKIQAETLNILLNPNHSASKIQVAQLDSELKLLLKEKEKLAIFATQAGVIGSVFVKSGEKVAPFTPILTLHSKNPSYVKGYIHENVYSRIEVGDKMEIISLADRNNRMVGQAVGVGTRIVEYPIRLRKIPELQMWGREVLIKIPQQNPFILGEKVLIHSQNIRKRDLQSWLKKLLGQGG